MPRLAALAGGAAAIGSAAWVAVARTTLMGADAYPTLDLKAAALLHSLCLNHALMDGNKRISAIAAIIFLDINGAPIRLSNDQLFELTMAVASGELRDVPEIAARLRAGEM